MLSKFCLEILDGRDHSEDISVCERIILKWVFGKYYGGVWQGFMWLRIQTGGRLLGEW
jgi:hypothetical protein